MLRLQLINRFFAVFEQAFQQVAADVILQRFAQRNALDQQRALNERCDAVHFRVSNQGL